MTTTELRQIAAKATHSGYDSILEAAAAEIEAFENQVSILRKEQQTLYDDAADLRRQNAALASALRKVVAWYDSKDSIDVLIDIEKEVKEALAAQPEGGAK